MSRAAKVPMQPAEIETALALLASGRTPIEVAQKLGRHERTIRELRGKAGELLARRSAPKARRWPMGPDAREALRAGALGRLTLRPPHVTAEPWSDKWYAQQAAAFAAAMSRHHPERVADRTLLTHPRITDETDSRSRPAALRCAGAQSDAAALGDQLGAAGLDRAGAAGSEPTRHGAGQRQQE